MRLIYYLYGSLFVYLFVLCSIDLSFWIFILLTNSTGHTLKLYDRSKGNPICVLAGKGRKRTLKIIPQKFLAHLIWQGVVRCKPRKRMWLGMQWWSREGPSYFTPCFIRELKTGDIISKHVNKHTVYVN